jgi:hypothetical protein
MTAATKIKLYHYANSHCLDAILAAMVGVRLVSLEEEGVCSQQF